MIGTLQGHLRQELGTCFAEAEVCDRAVTIPSQKFKSSRTLRANREGVRAKGRACRMERGDRASFPPHNIQEGPEPRAEPMGDMRASA